LISEVSVLVISVTVYCFEVLSLKSQTPRPVGTFGLNSSGLIVTTLTENALNIITDLMMARLRLVADWTFSKH